MEMKITHLTSLCVQKALLFWYPSLAANMLIVK